MVLSCQQQKRRAGAIESERERESGRTSLFYCASAASTYLTIFLFFKPSLPSCSQVVVLSSASKLCSLGMSSPSFRGNKVVVVGDSFPSGSSQC